MGKRKSLFITKQAVIDASTKAVERMQKPLGLSEWKIGVEYNQIEPCEAHQGSSAFGELTQVFPEYQKAVITIAPDVHLNAESVWETMRHELLHVLLSDFHHYHESVRDLLTQDDKTQRVAHTLYLRAAEYGVLHLEKLLDRLGYTSTAFMQKEILNAWYPVVNRRPIRDGEVYVGEPVDPGAASAA